MGKFIFGMMQSLDGYIAGPSSGPDSSGVLSSQAAAEMPPPDPILSGHFLDYVRDLDCILYGRLKIPKKQKPRGRLWLNDGSCVRLRPQQCEDP